MLAFIHLSIRGQWQEDSFVSKTVYLKFSLNVVAFMIYNNLNEMKFTHNAITSIMVEKVENITTSMTRAGLGDDTYRRQREK